MQSPQKLIVIVLALFLLGGCVQAQTDGDESESPTIAPTATLLPTVAPTKVPATEDEEFAVDVSADPDREREPKTVSLSGRYTIVPGESTARFELDEDLRSVRTGWGTYARITVIGSTDQVFGSFSFASASLADTQFDGLSIDADTFSTDEFYRTVAIQKTILESKKHPFITFEPLEVRDLPQNAVVGEEVVFNLDGELTIRDITLAQTLVVSATLVSPDRIEGTASTVVTRDSYGLEIVVAPHVVNVENEVELYIDFVAVSE